MPLNLNCCISDVQVTDKVLKAMKIDVERSKFLEECSRNDAGEVIIFSATDWPTYRGFERILVESMGSNLTVHYQCDGEHIGLTEDVSEEQMKALLEIFPNINRECVTHWDSIVIGLSCDAQMRESKISGMVYFDGMSRENAERVADGLEPIEEDD